MSKNVRKKRNRNGNTAKQSNRNSTTHTDPTGNTGILRNAQHDVITIHTSLSKDQYRNAFTEHANRDKEYSIERYIPKPKTAPIMELITDNNDRISIGTLLQMKKMGLINKDNPDLQYYYHEMIESAKKVLESKLPQDIVKRYHDRLEQEKRIEKDLQKAKLEVATSYNTVLDSLRSNGYTNSMIADTINDGISGLDIDSLEDIDPMQDENIQQIIDILNDELQIVKDKREKERLEKESNDPVIWEKRFNEEADRASQAMEKDPSIPVGTKLKDYVELHKDLYPILAESLSK